MHPPINSKIVINWGKRAQTFRRPEDFRINAKRFVCCNLNHFNFLVIGLLCIPLKHNTNLGTLMWHVPCYIIFKLLAQGPLWVNLALHPLFIAAMVSLNWRDFMWWTTKTAMQLVCWLSAAAIGACLWLFKNVLPKLIALHLLC